MGTHEIKPKQLRALLLLLVLVPFIPLVAPPVQAPLWALTLGAFLLYRPLYLPHNDLTWKTLATLPFLLAAALAWRNLRRSA